MRAQQKATELGQRYGMPRHIQVIVCQDAAISTMTLGITPKPEVMYFLRMELFGECGKPCQSCSSWLLQLMYVGDSTVGCFGVTRVWRYGTHAEVP